MTDYELVKPGCFIMRDEYAGLEQGPSDFNDSALLVEKLTTDMLPWGFQACIDPNNGIITGFRLEIAHA